MDLRQRIDDPEENLRAAIEQHTSKMWTSAPGKVVSVDMVKQTMSVQLAVKSFVKQEDGSQKAVDIPILQDVPFQFPGGGGMLMTFPVKPGDEVLVNFTARAPDTWQQSGGEQVPPDAGMHSLSNGFAQLGYRSNPNAAKVTDPSSTGAEMRSEDGMTKMSMSAAGGVAVSTDKSVSVAAAQGVAIGSGAGETAITGTVRITGELIVNGIVFSTHKHTGVQAGGSTSAGPTN